MILDSRSTRLDGRECCNFDVGPRDLVRKGLTICEVGQELGAGQAKDLVEAAPEMSLTKNTPIPPQLNQGKTRASRIQRTRRVTQKSYAGTSREVTDCMAHTGHGRRHGQVTASKHSKCAP